MIEFYNEHLGNPVFIILGLILLYLLIQLPFSIMKDRRNSKFRKVENKRQVNYVHICIYRMQNGYSDEDIDEMYQMVKKHEHKMYLRGAHHALFG